MTRIQVSAIDNAKQKIIIAVDFGTTFSGVAWVQTARPDGHTVITQWPEIRGSLEGVSSEKVPTKISYSNRGTRWGFMIEETEPKYQEFKLELNKNDDDNSYLSLNYPDPNGLPVRGHNFAMKLTVDYLRALKEHTNNLLHSKLGRAVMETTECEFVITVPAIWTEVAKQTTRRCAVEAGMSGNVHIVSEPEAAVIYSLHAMDPATLEKGDRFVMCDAGGGTVDLITYEIVERHPLNVREVVAGSGSKCGSIYLNRKFSKFMQDNYSTLPGWGQDTLDEALNHFENFTKRNFKGTETRVLIPVPGLANNAELGILRAKLNLPREVILSMFEPVISTITELVKGQIASAEGEIKAVLLVGGFGQSPYLREMIKTTISSHIQVLQPPQGWTAVVRGALLKVLSQLSPDDHILTISSRIARKCYGIVIGTKYRPNDHAGFAKYWDPYSGSYQVSVLDWKIKTGDQLYDDKPISVRYFRSQNTRNGPFQICDTHIYAFENKNGNPPPLRREPGFKILATLQTDLRSIPATRSIISKGKDGQNYYRIDYEIRISFKSAHIDYSMWYQGECYGSVEVDYNQ